MEHDAIEHVAHAIGELAECGEELTKRAALREDLRRCIAGAFEEAADAAGEMKAALKMQTEG